MSARTTIPILLALTLSATACFAQRGGRNRGAQQPAPMQRNLARPAPPQRQGAPPQQPAPQPQPREQQQQPVQQDKAPGFHLHGPGPHAGDWLRQHEGLPPDQRLKALEQDPTYQKLSPQRQERLRNSLQNFDNLPQQRQWRILQRMEEFEHLSPEQQQRARGLFQQMRDLPQDRRQELMRGFRDLRDLSPEERQKTIDSDSFKTRFSDQERDLLRGMSDVGIAPPGRPVPRPPQDNQ